MRLTLWQAVCLVVHGMMKTPSKEVVPKMSPSQRAICASMHSCNQVQIMGDGDKAKSPGKRLEEQHIWDLVLGIYKKLSLQHSGRPVYMRFSEAKAGNYAMPKFLYFVKSKERQQWIVGNSVGNPSGWLYVSDVGTTPECIRLSPENEMCSFYRSSLSNCFCFVWQSPLAFS